MTSSNFLLRISRTIIFTWRGRPGVYVQEKKLAALGLRIRRGASYHGLSINVDMDLSPFSNIHPCGFAGLQVTQLVDLGIELSIPQVSTFITQRLQTLLLD